MRVEEIRLNEVEANAAFERRPSNVAARRSGASEEIQVTVFGIDPSAFIRAVAQSKVEAMAGAFGNGEPRGDLGRLELLVERLDIGELKQLHPIQVPLRVLQLASLIQVSGLV